AASPAVRSEPPGRAAQERVLSAPARSESRNVRASSGERAPGRVGKACGASPGRAAVERVPGRAAQQRAPWGVA
ncbi:hypothetical protein CYMTET_30856, partial [Cymbomonas tetramitiformis]